MAISVVGQNGQGAIPTAEDAGTFADVLGLSMIVLADTTGAFWDEWNPEDVLPVTYVIDRAGVITYRDSGDAGALPEIRDHVMDLLGL